MTKLKCKCCSEFVELESALLNFNGNCYYCGEALSIPQKVAVYYNLDKKTYSIMDHSGERKRIVIGYADEILLSSVEFKVSEKGRQRVIKEKRKNVHAYIMGYDCRLKDDSELTFNWVRAKYKTEIGNLQNEKTFFCSALVSFVYMTLGLLPLDTKWSIIEPCQLGTEKDNNNLTFINCNIDDEIIISD